MKIFAVVLAFIFFLVSCGNEARQAFLVDQAKSQALASIRDNLASTAGIQFFNPICDDFAEAEFTTEFSCTASTVDDELVRFNARIGSNNNVAVSTVNLIPLAAVNEVEVAATSALLDLSLIHI